MTAIIGGIVIGVGVSGIAGNVSRRDQPGIVPAVLVDQDVPAGDEDQNRTGGAGDVEIDRF